MSPHTWRTEAVAGSANMSFWRMLEQSNQYQFRQLLVPEVLVLSGFPYFPMAVGPDGRGNTEATPGEYLRCSAVQAWPREPNRELEPQEDTQQGRCWKHPCYP